MRETRKAREHPLERAAAAVLKHVTTKADRAGLVAISGGADSTALLAALAASAPRGAWRLFAFHVNHAQRGAESDEDERAARRLARRLKVPFRSAKAPLPPGASEDALREARYAAIESEAARRKARYVFLGHHADDLAETVLMRLARGAGLDGLAGFGRCEPRGRLVLVRPFIEARRADILAYLEERDLPWREDSSNADRRYLRNRLRLDVLPLLEETFHGRVVEAIARAALLLQRDADCLDTLTDRALISRTDYSDEGGVVLDLTGWRALPIALRTRILRRAVQEASGEALPPSQANIESLDQLALSGRQESFAASSGGIVVVRRAGRLLFAPHGVQGRRPTPVDAERAVEALAGRRQGRLKNF